MTAQDKKAHDCMQAETLARIESKLNSIDQKLFIGNGVPSWAIRLDRAERFVSILTYLITGVTLAGVLYGIGTIFTHTWGVLE